MTTLNPMTGEGSGEGRLPPRELLANAPVEYDEVDNRLMDTFPASDAVGRY